jgi:hypothetical protein
VIIWARREGGRGTMALPQSELTVANFWPTWRVAVTQKSPWMPNFQLISIKANKFKSIQMYGYHYHIFCVWAQKTVVGHVVSFWTPLPTQNLAKLSTWSATCATCCQHNTACCRLGNKIDILTSDLMGKKSREDQALPRQWKGGKDDGII